MTSSQIPKLDHFHLFQTLKIYFWERLIQIHILAVHYKCSGEGAGNNTILLFKTFIIYLPSRWVDIYLQLGSFTSINTHNFLTYNTIYPIRLSLCIYNYSITSALYESYSPTTPITWPTSLILPQAREAP